MIPGTVLDIMYANIRHAFFQPAENDLMTVVHFHLVDPIMAGKKKTNDIQFYTEVRCRCWFLIVIPPESGAYF